MTWSGFIVLACCVLVMWGCIASRTRSLDAEENVRKMLVWWWKQAKPGMPIPHELQRRK